jgi:hypothetical protein
MVPTASVFCEAVRDPEHPLPEGGVRELLATLPAEAVRSLLHVLECPSCQDAALAAYLRRTCRVRFPGRQTLPWA